MQFGGLSYRKAFPASGPWLLPLIGLGLTTNMHRSTDTASILTRIG